MGSPVLPSEAALPRHQLVRIRPAAWAALLALRPELDGEPLLGGWAERGWPLIVRRALPDETEEGLPLGLPLPPSAGKRRIAVQIRHGDIVSVAALPDLADAMASAPPAWQACLRELIAAGDRHGVQPRVFGSLAWQHLTGLSYLGPASDLDLIWPLPRRERIGALLADLARIEARAPMRLDGELVRADGAGVNWRELHAGIPELALKTAADVVLCSIDEFAGEPA